MANLSHLQRDGRIVHIHRALALPGATAPPDAEIEADALEFARRSMADAKSQLSILDVDDDDIEFGVEYKVDVRKKVLEEVRRWIEE